MMNLLNYDNIKNNKQVPTMELAWDKQYKRL